LTWGDKSHIKRGTRFGSRNARYQSGAIDILSDQRPSGAEFLEDAKPHSLARRTFLNNGSGIDWRVPEGISVTFAGEGEWKITLDVFRDLGLAFGAARLMIYITIRNT